MRSSCVREIVLLRETLIIVVMTVKKERLKLQKM